MHGLLNPYRFAAAGGVVGGPTTWDPAAKASTIALSNGNLTAAKSTSSSTVCVLSTTPKANGKWHFEVTLNVLAGSAGFISAGVGTAAVNVEFSPGNSASMSYRGDGIIRGNSVNVADTTVTYTQGDTVAIEVDLDAMNFYVQKSGGSRKGPYSISYMSAPLFALVAVNTLGDQWTANFGATSFAIAPTAGYSAWG